MLIHKYKLNGYNIVIDTNSNGIHLVSDAVYDMVDRIAPPLDEKCPDELFDLPYAKDEIEEAYADIRELWQNDLLYAPKIETGELYKGKIPIKSMCLHISHDCNMRCEYCFASAGDYGRDRSLMSLEVGKKAIDFLLEKSLHIKNLELDFFGGEPLMNFDVVKELVKYGREQEKKLGKHIRFTMTTNGALLDDEAIDFINAEMHNVVLSIDGRKEVNDKMRPFEDGSGTYDVILPRYKKLVEKRTTGSYYVRGTFTHDNLDFSKDVIHLADCGFDEISVEPVVLEPENKYALREEDLPIIFEEYEKLAKEIIKRDAEGRHFNFFHFMIDLDNGPCVYKRCKGCGSGSEYVAVTPNGDIYPCHQFVGDTSFKIGNIYDERYNYDIQKTFALSTIDTNPECDKCWAKYFCGGGCAANNSKFNKDIKIPYKMGCELERKRVECAIMIKAAQSARNTEE